MAGIIFYIINKDTIGLLKHANLVNQLVMDTIHVQLIGVQAHLHA